MFTKLALLSALAGLATLVVASPIRAPVGWHLAGTDDLDIVAGSNDAAGDATDAPAPAPDALPPHEHQARAPDGLRDLSRLLNGLRPRDFLDGDAPAPGGLAPRRLPDLSNDELRRLSRVIGKSFIRDLLDGDAPAPDVLALHEHQARAPDGGRDLSRSLNGLRIRDLLDGDGPAPAPEALAQLPSDQLRRLDIISKISIRDLLDGEGSLASLLTSLGVIAPPSLSPPGPGSSSPVMPLDLPGSPVNLGKRTSEAEAEGMKPILEGSLSDGGLIGGLSGKGEIL